MFDIKGWNEEAAWSHISYAWTQVFVGINRSHGDSLLKTVDRGAQRKVTVHLVLTDVLRRRLFPSLLRLLVDVLRRI